MKRMDFIRKMGNNAAHTGKKITKEQAILCLENLQIFLDFVCYCYADEYEEHTFDKSLFAKTESEAVKTDFPDVDVQKLIAENSALKKELTSRRGAGRDICSKAA